MTSIRSPPSVHTGKNPAGTTRGAGGREALTVLREAGEPLTSSEIAQRVLEKLGKDDTPASRGMLANTIHGTLSRRKDGAVLCDASIYPARWIIAADRNKIARIDLP